MTFSLLARDLRSGALCGAAATGNLCVGGWVLRGDSRGGLTASQGMAPSHLWGEDALAAMCAGMTAEQAVAQVTAPDRGRDARQLSAIDTGGRSAAFTGAANTDWKGALVAPDLVLAGNMLSGAVVLRAAREAWAACTGAAPDRLLAALAAGQAAGGDSRGLMSAAILIVARDAPPLSLRVDWAEDPVAALTDLVARTRASDYARWLASVPTRDTPECHRGPGGAGG